MNIGKNKEAIHIIADHFGREHQAIKAIEEMAELTKELVKDIQGEPRRENIMEELADVLLMLTQLAYLYGIKDGEYLEIIEIKAKRTLEKIYGGEEKCTK